jgi:hypothetical protein
MRSVPQPRVLDPRAGPDASSPAHGDSRLALQGKVRLRTPRAGPLRHRSECEYFATRASSRRESFATRAVQAVLFDRRASRPPVPPVSPVRPLGRARFGEPTRMQHPRAPRGSVRCVHLRLLDKRRLPSPSTRRAIHRCKFFEQSNNPNPPCRYRTSGDIGYSIHVYEIEVRRDSAILDGVASRPLCI